MTPAIPRTDLRCHRTPLHIKHDQLGITFLRSILVTGYPDRGVGVSSPGDSPTSANCVANSVTPIRTPFIPMAGIAAQHQIRYGSPHYYHHAAPRNGAPTPRCRLDLQERFRGSSREPHFYSGEFVPL